jgi:hypothetical protein
MFAPTKLMFIVMTDARPPRARGLLCAQISLLLEISGRALAGIGRFAGSDAKSHRPDDSIQSGFPE